MYMKMQTGGLRRMISKVLLRTLSAMIALIFFIGAPSAVPNGTKTETPEDTELQFSVISDIHMETNNRYSRGVYLQIIRNMKAYSDARDALVMLGDNTMNGQLLENLILYGLTSRIDPANVYVPVAGNHDTGNNSGNFDNLYKRYVNFRNAFGAQSTDKIYYSTKVNGYTFICLASEQDTSSIGYYSDEQIEWLEATLAAEYEEGKPIFIFSHYPPNWAEDDKVQKLYSIFSGYDNLFYFSGHLHRPGISFSDFGGMAAINLPRVTECSEDDGQTQVYTGWGVEVKVTTSSVIINQYDFYRAKLLESVEYPLS